MAADKISHLKLAGILGLVLLIFGYLVFDRFSGAPVETPVQEGQELDAHSIAVLPFLLADKGAPSRIVCDCGGPQGASQISRICER